MKPTKEDIERQVQDALERQEIRNVDYECLKNWANRLVDDAFDAQIRDKIYDLTNGESPLRHDAYMIVCEFGVMGLYEVPSRIRKLQAWKTNPDKNIKDWNKPFNSSLMSGLEEFFSQWQQLAADFVSLKLFIKKGRVKSVDTPPAESAGDSHILPLRVLPDDLRCRLAPTSQRADCP